MKTTRMAGPVLAACTLLILPNAVRADGDWRDAWLAAYPAACPELVAAAQGCVLCHTAVPRLNPYGRDMGSMDFSAIEGMDSDGDARTNGEEIDLDCTLPGDPSSVPVTSGTWGAVKALYR